jgi:NTP pyrophosphatase (non-canonical NTP hydrolase)
MPTDINKLIEKIKKFNYERDWDQYHNPKDILIALVSEVGELAECYRWLNEKEISVIHTDPEKKKKVEEEIADIMINLIILSYKANVDIVKAIQEKLEKNKKKYPVEKSKGKHSNFMQGFKGKE